MPIVVWGSTIVLKLVERFPGVVYFGAARAASGRRSKMIDSEPLLREWLQSAPVLAALELSRSIPLVLWIGFLQNHRQLESRIHARLAAFKLQRPWAAARSSPRSRRSLMANRSRKLVHEKWTRLEVKENSRC